MKIHITGWSNKCSATLYTQTNQDIEKVCEIIYLIMTKLSVAGTILPPLLLTAVNYFVYDLHDESYFLPFPVM